MVAFRVNLAQDILRNYICYIWFYYFILEFNIINSSVEDGVFIVVTDKQPIYIKRTSNLLCKIVTLPMRRDKFGINKCGSNWIWWKWCFFFIYYVSLRDRYGTVFLIPLILCIWRMLFHRACEWVAMTYYALRIKSRSFWKKNQHRWSIHQVTAGVKISEEQLVHWSLIPNASFHCLCYLMVLDSNQELQPCVETFPLRILHKPIHTNQI